MTSEYASLGKVGIGTPQANPTVEAEMAILLPRACSLHVTRLTSAASSATDRLCEYLLEIERALAAFDVLRPNVFAFACTGSSYLLGAPKEQQLVAAAEARFGYPIITATRAMAWGLERMGARRIALVAPYPADLIEAASRYWSEAGFEVVRAQRIPTRTADTRGIYELTSDDLTAVLSTVPCDDSDAVVVSGTGLPSLSTLRRAQMPVPAVSSNHCLAARVLDLLGHADLIDWRLPVIHGWERRLDEALANTAREH